MAERSDRNRGLTYGAPVGCIAGFVFAALALAGVFLGSVMGDCLPDVDCKRDLGGNLLRAAFVVIPAALVIGFIWRWLANASLPVITRYVGFGVASFLILFAAVILSAITSWYSLPIIADLIF